MLLLGSQAVTKYHRPLASTEMYFLTVLKAEKSKTKRQLGWVSAETTSSGLPDYLLTPKSSQQGETEGRGETERRDLSSSSYKATFPSDEGPTLMTSFDLNYLLNGLPR